MGSGSDARLFHIALPRMDNGKGRARWGGAGLSVLGDRALHFFKKGSCDEAEQFLRFVLGIGVPRVKADNGGEPILHVAAGMFGVEHPELILKQEDLVNGDILDDFGIGHCLARPFFEECFVVFRKGCHGFLAHHADGPEVDPQEGSHLTGVGSGKIFVRHEQYGLRGVDGARCGRDFKPMFVSGVTVGGPQHDGVAFPPKKA